MSADNDPDRPVDDSTGIARPDDDTAGTTTDTTGKAADDITGNDTTNGNAADDTYERGVAMVTEVYQGEVPALPEGTMAFNDVMMRSLFAEVWDRDVLSIRDRRLLIMGVIAAKGATDVWKLQAQSALKRGELTPDELRETLIALAPYAGYPSVAPLVGPCETAIGDWQRAED